MNEAQLDRRNALLRAGRLLWAKVQSRKHAYSCFIDEQPTELVPEAARRQLELAAGVPDLIVNESFRYCADGDPPAELAELRVRLDGFLLGYPLAWIQDPGTAMWTPFWARDDWIAALSSLRAGAAPPRDLPPSVRGALAVAGILVPRGYAQLRKEHWRRVLEQAHAAHSSSDYCVVRDLVNPLQLGAMRRYYRALVEGGTLVLGDSQVPDRYVLHSELIANLVHLQLTPVVSRIAGARVKPSFAFFASYREGAELPAHTDRPQCEFGISLLCDYAPERNGPCGWPLLMHDPAAPHVVHAADLAMGDALFYRGRKLVHYRHALPQGHHSTSLLLHYVREDFTGQLT